jgi:hypothetical protein
VVLVYAGLDMEGKIMTWDLQALLAVVVIAGLALIAVPVAYGIHRAIKFHKSKQYRYAYLPHSTSHKPWKQNEWRA